MNPEKLKYVQKNEEHNIDPDEIMLMDNEDFEKAYDLEGTEEYYEDKNEIEDMRTEYYSLEDNLERLKKEIEETSLIKEKDYYKQIEINDDLKELNMKYDILMQRKRELEKMYQEYLDKSEARGER